MSPHRASPPNEARQPDPSHRPDAASPSAGRHAPITGAARPQRMMAPIDDDAWKPQPDRRLSPGRPARHSAPGDEAPLAAARPPIVVRPPRPAVSPALATPAIPEPPAIMAPIDEKE